MEVCSSRLIRSESLDMIKLKIRVHQTVKTIALKYPPTTDSVPRLSGMPDLLNMTIKIRINVTKCLRTTGPFYAIFTHFSTFLE